MVTYVYYLDRGYMVIRKQTKTNIFRIRLSNHEIHKLQAFATKHNKSMSQIIRSYIGKLPNIKGESEYI